MGQTFPTGVPAYADTAGGEVLGSLGGGLGLSRILDDYGLDIEGLATKMGTGSSTPAAGKVLRANGAGTSVWGAVDLSTDVATFSSATIASLVTDETGSGSMVFSNSPTIVTPTIASFVNATHNHQNSAGGGQLDGSSSLTAGSVARDRLATTTRKWGLNFAYATFPAAGTTNGPHLKFIVPDNYTTGNIVLKGLFRNSVGSNTAVLRVNTYRFRDGAAFSQIDNDANFDRAVTDTNTHVRTITTISSANFQAGDALFTTIIRLGDDAGDTNTGAEDQDAAWIEYTGYV